MATIAPIQDTRPGMGGFTPGNQPTTLNSGAAPLPGSNFEDFQKQRMQALGDAGNSIQSPYYTPVGATGLNPEPKTQYSVITSKPATDQVNGIQTAYNTQIAPAVANATATNAATNAANKSLPVIEGYNVTPTPTGNSGETKATNPTTGESYYITPQKPAASASDIQSILSGGETTPTSATPSTTTPAPQTPTQTAEQQTGINATAENATYAANIATETNAITSAANTFQNAIATLSSGGMPLTSAQQALVDATNNAFEQMTTQANLKAAALSSETGGVADKVNAMGGRLISIATEQAAAIAKLEVGFQQQNFDERYKTVTAAYDAFKTAEDAKVKALSEIHATVMDTYNKAVAAAQAQQTFNQTVYKDAQTLAQSRYEFRDLKDAFGNTIGMQVYDKATGVPIANHYAAGQTDPSTGVSTPIVTANPNTGTVDPVIQNAYLQTIPSAYRSLVQGIINGKIEPPSARTAKGAQILSWVASADPTLSDGSGGFDATKYQARLTMQKSLASYTSGSYGQGVLSANKVVSHLASFLNSANAIPGKGAVNPLGVNKLGAEIAGGIGAMVGAPEGQKVQGEAQQDARGLVDEMTKFFKGTGGTDVESIKSWSQGLDPYASSGTLQGTVQGTLDLYSGQLNSFIQQYQTVMGHEPDMGTILQPQTIQELGAFKNAGYKVDLPGIYYTDKSAWQNYGGGTQDQWNGAVDSLTKNGIPLTEDNILHAAQILNE